jgi:hypothetical protein
MSSGVVTNTNDDGAGSLRFAIYHANASVGTDSITFDIPGSGPHVITPMSSLPPLLDHTVINGYTQSGAEESSAAAPAIIQIHLDGSLTSDECSGLTLVGGGSTIRGLAIGGFPLFGIVITGTGGTVVEGTFVGTNASGTASIGNGMGGLLISNSGGNSVGGSTAATRNVISGNNGNGVEIAGQNSSENVILGNYVGLDAFGSALIGNTGSGIYVNGPNNTIGGTAVGAGNVVSGNESGGIYVFGAAATENTLCGNQVGTSANGTEPLGNVGWGIWVRSQANTVGGSASGSCNIISGNSAGGIYIAPIGAAENVVRGNLIGTDVSGSLGLANEGPGIRIQAPRNTVGGADAADANIVAFNKGSGIEIGSGTDNMLSGNQVFLNEGLGIDLGGDGVTLNDDGDGDSGANGLQNYPELVSAAVDSLNNTVRIQGSLNSIPNATFMVEFFHSTEADSSGYGDGAT